MVALRGSNKEQPGASFAPPDCVGRCADCSRPERRRPRLRRRRARGKLLNADLEQRTLLPLANPFGIGLSPMP